jgi:hypothetical protein
LRPPTVVVGGPEFTLGKVVAGGTSAVGVVTKLVVVTGKGVVSGGIVVTAGGGAVTGTLRFLW